MTEINETKTLSSYITHTVLKNPTSTDKYYGFLENGMGLTIKAGATATVPYDIFNPPDVAWNYRKYDYIAIVKQCIESGEIEVLATPGPIYYDLTAEIGKALVVEDGVIYASAAVITSDDSSGSSSSSAEETSTSEESSSSAE